VNLWLHDGSFFNELGRNFFREPIRDQG
jgi:hypothetical protein